MDFIDLKKQQARIKPQIDAGIKRVLAHGQYILGPEVAALESQLADFGKAKHVMSCASGTDALLLPLMAWGIGPGDAVFCPSFSFAATAEVIALVGAEPVFIDIEPSSYNICPDSLSRAIDHVISEGRLRPRAIIAVDLFGRPADYVRIAEIAANNALYLIADSAQGFGSTLGGNHPLNWAHVATTSFFPAKPLGCYGDGGAILTNDDELSLIMRSLANHGKGRDKYDNVRIGTNSRLDSIQAAILIEKLAIFPDEIAARQRIAARYNAALANHVMRIPAIGNDHVSTWAQYTIEVTDPAAMAQALAAKSIPSARYYPVPIHRQSAYSEYECEGGQLSATDFASQHVISLPMHPYLSESDQDTVLKAVIGAANQQAA